MSQTITVRLSPDLAEWLVATAAKSSVSQGKIVRDQLELARRTVHDRDDIRTLAGVPEDSPPGCDPAGINSH